MIGHGEVEGPFTEIDGLAIQRDARFPIRVTVQFYKATSNGVVDGKDIRMLADQIDSVYADAKAIGSLVAEADRGKQRQGRARRWRSPRPMQISLRPDSILYGGRHRNATVCS